MNKKIAVATVVGSLLAGGVAGATLFGPIGANAQSNNGTTETTATTDPNAPAANAAPKPNEGTDHEATESAEREAAEDNGTAFQGGDHHRGGPRGEHVGDHAPNEDQAHETTESPGREAEEDARTTTTTSN